ncbi:hypothetical protein QWY16_12420 [Planococcus shenhongbingii]|uniref:hypothetical protein n=1 Tax=Planococcus shenhongbingii TaxID=3058398 RepID=UPI00262FE25A|nr:hypothetical protein [Planococcus sp. N016]WKA57303.1 hypothetical protein QWY16_12420 [Planococcus sp. N016]
MTNSIEKNFELAGLYEYIRSRLSAVGLWIHNENAKETLQFFKNEKSFLLRERYLGAIQYEGSADFSKKEPHTVSFRFKRSNLTDALKNDLEKIITFRCDKNKGPSINPLSESIAFKFKQLGENEKSTIDEIIRTLKEHLR